MLVVSRERLTKFYETHYGRFQPCRGEVVARSTLHNFGCALAFGDGHSELHKWSDPSAAYLDQSVPLSPSGGRDWTWLAAHTSARVSNDRGGAATGSVKPAEPEN
jgi:hypothetical protein